MQFNAGKFIIQNDYRNGSIVVLEQRQKESTYFLNLAILTTDPILRLFHVKDYSMT